MIHLLDIDPGNWRIDLAVSEAQKPFVSDRAKLLARAYAYRARRSRAFLICADDLPVGMGLYYDEPELQSYDLSQMFIDARYQSRGYGKAAVRAIRCTAACCRSCASHAYMALRFCCCRRRILVSC